MSLENQLLLPPSALICPEIEKGRLDLRSDSALRARIDADRPILPLGLDADDSLQNRLAGMNQVLLQYREKAISGIPRPKESNTESQWTRELLKKLFPALEKVIKEGKEEDFLGDRCESIEDYVNTYALPAAKSYRSWLIGQHLPSSYWQPLELLEDVNNATTLFDLVKLYSGKTVTVAAISNEPEGQIYYRQIEQQVTSLLSLMYLASLVDLSRKPEEEKVIRAFTDQASSAFSIQEEIGLFVKLDHNGKCVLMHLHSQNEDRKLLAQSRSRSGFIDHHYSARRWGSVPKAVAIFQQREKQEYSEISKILRGRPFPVTDRLGVRFIIGDKNLLSSFINALHIKLPEWEFVREVKDTPNPQSRLSYPVKYVVRRMDISDISIEMQIDWLMDGEAVRGTWIPKRYEHDYNFYAYRMRQLLEEIFPKIFPTDSCGIDWASERVQIALMEHANYIATH